MKVGDLIRYYTTNETEALGIVVEGAHFFEKYNEDAVKVYWLDSLKPNCTYEKTRELLDPQYSYYEVISESR